MQDVIIKIINKYGYVGILLLIAIENIFPPIPSEVILTFSGFMTTKTTINVIGVIIFSTIGSVIGAFVLYGVGRILNKERIERIIKGRIGKVLRLKKKDIEKADAWFDKKGNIAVFFGRFIPIVRSLISIPAGMSRMPIFNFFIYTTFGTLIWNSVLVTLGAVTGENYKQIVSVIDSYAKIILILLVIIVIIGIYIFYKKKNKGTK